MPLPASPPSRPTRRPSTAPHPSSPTSSSPQQPASPSTPRRPTSPASKNARSPPLPSSASTPASRPPRSSSLSPPPYPGLPGPSSPPRHPQHHPHPHPPQISPASPAQPVLSYPSPEIDTLYPTLVTTTTTTTTTTVTTTQVQETKHLFSGLALPGLGLLRRKSMSRPGSSGTGAGGGRIEGRGLEGPGNGVGEGERGGEGSPSRRPTPAQREQGQPSPTRTRTGDPPPRPSTSTPPLPSPSGGPAGRPSMQGRTASAPLLSSPTSPTPPGRPSLSASSSSLPPLPPSPRPPSATARPSPDLTRLREKPLPPSPPIDNQDTEDLELEQALSAAASTPLHRPPLPSAAAGAVGEAERVQVLQVHPLPDTPAVTLTPSSPPAPSSGSEQTTPILQPILAFSPPDSASTGSAMALSSPLSAPATVTSPFPPPSAGPNPPSTQSLTQRDVPPNILPHPFPLPPSAPAAAFLAHSSLTPLQGLGLPSLSQLSQISQLSQQLSTPSPQWSPASISTLSPSSTIGGLPGAGGARGGGGGAGVGGGAGEGFSTQALPANPNPKRFSIRRAKSFDRPSHSQHHHHHQQGRELSPPVPQGQDRRLSYFPQAALGASPFASSLSSSSALSSGTATPNLASGSTTPAGGAAKVHFAPEKRPRRPRTATLPVLEHASPYSVEQGLDLGAGSRRTSVLSPEPGVPPVPFPPPLPLPGQGGRPPGPATTPAAGLPDPTTAPSSAAAAGSGLPPPPPPPPPPQQQQQQQEKRGFWSRLSRPGSSKGRDSPDPVPAPSALSGAPATIGGAGLGPGERSAGQVLGLTEEEVRGLATPSPPLLSPGAAGAPGSAGGGAGGGGLWERAARRRASSAFLRSFIGSSSSTPAQAAGNGQEALPRQSGQGEPVDWPSAPAPGDGKLLRRSGSGKLRQSTETHQSAPERGRKRASTLLSPVQIWEGKMGGEQEKAFFALREEQRRAAGPALDSPEEGRSASAAAPVGDGAALEERREAGFSTPPPSFPVPVQIPTPSSGVSHPSSSSRPGSRTASPITGPARTDTLPPRSRSTTLDSLASLATSFPWARNSLLLGQGVVIPGLTSSGSGAGAGVGVGNGSAPGHTYAGSDPPTPAAGSPTAGATGGQQGPGRRPSLSRLGMLGLGGGKKSGSMPAGLGGVLLEDGGTDEKDGEEEGRRRTLEKEREREREERRRKRRTLVEVEREVELERVIRTVSRAELAGVLCGTPLLALHLSRLSPSPFPQPQLYSPGLPLDISLRVLLMHLALPKETQAIDRFVETFATNWAERYPGLVSPDQAYLLAFSMIILHTDQFNPSNKRKMSREDYVRNTKRDAGVGDVVLEYFYDNITFTRFIFVEDAVDVHGQRSLMPAADITPSGISISPALSSSASSSQGRSKGKKIDVYYLIAQGRLDPLRATVSAWIPPFDPYAYAGSHGGGADEWVERCNEAFAGAAEVRVDSVSGRSGTGLASLGNFGAGSIPGAASGLGTASMMEGQDGGMMLKLTKVGALLRRQETEAGRKASNSKWRNLGVAITGSQLLFFKDPNWIRMLKDNADEAKRTGGQPPRLATFRPDDWVSLRDAVALYDTTYLEHEYTFRLVLPQQKQYLFQVPSEEELNEWMSLINYAASFKTAGVRMRSAGMTSRQLGLAALAAAESHVREVRSASGASSPAHLSRVVSLDDTPPPASPGVLTPVESGTDSATAVSNSPSLPSLPDPADQLEATFREIKAELAAFRPGMADLGLGIPPAVIARRSPTTRAQSLFVGHVMDHSTPHPPELPRSNSLGPLTYSSVNSSGEFSVRKGWLASRSEVIERKLLSFSSELARVEPQLEAELRASRNFAMLTPFQKSTREKITAAIQPLARRVTQLRMDVARLKCYCDVLRSDLDAEQREWVETKQAAFDVAEARLGSGGRAAGRGLRVDVPRMTLSMHLESPHELETDSLSSRERGPYTPALGRPASTRTAESGRSTAFVAEGEEGSTPEPAWPVSEVGSVPTPGMLFRSGSIAARSVNSSMLGTPDALPTPTNGRFSLDTLASPEPSTPISPVPPVSPGAPQAAREGQPLSPAVEEGIEADEDKERAEDWEATKCARRVSLVQTPAAGLKPRLSGRSQGYRSSDENPREHGEEGVKVGSADAKLPGKLVPSAEHVQ